MKLILMTRPEFFIEEHQILNALFDEGLDTLHLRKPHTEPVYSERLLSLISSSYHKNIVTHDHFYLKNEYGLKGIHLNGRNPQLPHNYKGHISCSCHNAEELQKNAPFCNYLFLSPVFDANHPLQLNPSLPLKQLHQQKLINRNVYALGGAGLDNLSLLRNTEFGGIVVLGDIWNRFNIHTHQDFKEVIQHFRKLKKALQ